MHEDPVSSLPQPFQADIRQLMGEERFARFCEGMRGEVPVSIRLNPWKCRGRYDAVAPESRVPWCEDAFYLQSRPNFTFDPLLHAGLYYVQEASSMFVGHVLRQCVPDLGRPLLVLDMCAAPGGKSIAALSALPEGTLLVSNEPIRARAQVLAENLHKWGADHALVTNNYPRDFRDLRLAADVLLCDVPCSGEGMFRKDRGAISEWSEERVVQCAQLQREIVAEAWRQLRPGGLMIYSTCTINSREDEENVAWIVRELGAEPVEVSTDPGWGIEGSLTDAFRGPVYRFLPGLTRGEGLFMAVLRKPADDSDQTEPSVPRSKKQKAARRKEPARQQKDPLAACSRWLRDDHSYSVLELGDTLCALPEALRTVYDAVDGRLSVMKAGVSLGRVKGRDVIPDQSLALSPSLSPAAFPRAEVAYADAIAYLRKEAILLPADTPRGLVLLTYDGQPLGFVKNLGTRANNLYPQEWRIKSTHVPEEEHIIKTR